MKHNRIHILFTSVGVILMAALFMLGCSTRKNTPLNRGYHNMTSRFNVNFNGKEALKTGEADHAKLCQDNYITTLPIYNYPAKENLSSIYPAMDRVIEKGSKCIYKHSMFFKGKEYVKHIDDAYLMMGKAYFYKQDYTQAQRIFNYIITTHKDGNCVEEAMIWNARCAVRQGYYSQAEDIINEAKYFVQPKKNKKLNLAYAAAGAELELTSPTGDREVAIDYINDVLKNKPSKLFKTRMYFILGQLYELEEQPASAHEYFLWVAKHSPDYEMEFNARMHLATNYDGSPAKRAQIIKELNKMLAEEKNKDYYDQIYFALSEIDRIDEDTTSQMNNLTKSVAAYQNNDFQRTHSSLRLADLYFDKEQYPQAQAYYDTATTTMPKTYPNYAEIKRKSEVLTELVQNLQLVVVQDSLQRIAKMSQSERDRWVKNKIAAYKQEKARKEKEERDKELAMQSALGYTNYNQLNNSGSSGKWYFYNSTLMSAGKTEFLRKWGNRKLEDNWRISNKQQLSFDDLANMNNPDAAKDTTEYDENGNPVQKRETDPEKELYYTQDLPLTPGAMDTSNAMIAEALYQASIIYLDLLNDQKRGCETLEKFYARFPEHNLSPGVLYLLYLNYSKMNNGKAEQPKNIILTKYPDTDIARLIREPDYYKKVAEKLKEMETKYETVYQDYSNKQWKKVIAAADAAIPNCSDKTLRSQYAYLRAVSIGQTQSKDNYRAALQGVLADYGDQGVAELARILLADLDPVPVATPQPQTESAHTSVKDENSPFSYAPDEWHYVTLIINVHKIKVMDFKVTLSDFNKEFYSLQKFTINSFYINQDEQIVTVSRFRNADAAMDYYNAVLHNDKFKADVMAKNIIPYVMSATNYSTYYKEKDKRNLYEEFFSKNYLNQ